MTTISFPSSIKAELIAISDAKKYIQVLEVLGRGTADELVLNDAEEAQAVVDVARVKLLDTQLKFPYWDDSKDNYIESHEDAFQEVQMGVFEKTVSYVGQAFSIRTEA